MPSSPMATLKNSTLGCNALREPTVSQSADQKNDVGDFSMEVANLSVSWNSLYGSVAEMSVLARFYRLDKEN